MSTAVVRVLVADDDESVREALADLVSAQADLTLVAVAGDHTETARLATELQPDVVLMDVRMPEGSGPGTVRTIRMQSPRTAVVALSAFEDRDSVVAMLAAGVVGYQVKGSSDTELLDAVRRAPRGQLSMPLDLLLRCFRGVLREKDDDPQANPRSRHTEEMFHQLLDRAPVGVVLLSTDDRIRFANAETDRIFRREVSNLIGLPAFVLLSKPFRGEFLARLASARDTTTEDPSGVGLACLHGDGTEFAAVIDMRPLELGQELLVAVFFRPLSDAEDRQARYQQRTDMATDCLVVIDSHGTIELVDAQTESLFGYRQDELVGRSISLLVPGRRMADDLRQWVEGHPIAQASAGGPGTALTGTHKDGTGFPVDVGLNALRNDDRRLLVASIRDLSEQRRYERVLEQSFHVLKDNDRDHQLLLDHLVRAQEEERMRIAAGIHDDTLQAITAASLRLQQLRRRLHRPSDVALLARLEETIQLSISRLRHLTFDLQPPASEGGLVTSLASYLDELHADTGIDVHVDNKCRTELSSKTVVIAYRIAQEALNNVRKHAQANAVWVRLRGVDNGCLVTIEDDGVGYDPGTTESKPGHLGLTLMQERAQIAGGWCRIESAPGAGTTVELWLPRDTGVGADDQRGTAALDLRP
jgi:PAS domain S-box-containing protein